MTNSVKIEDLRSEYSGLALLEKDAGNDPVALFEKWFTQATRAELRDPNAMILATATKVGRPSARVMLLKEFNDKGFVFYTNYESRKGLEIKENPWGTIVFFWHELMREVRLEGEISIISRKESEEYFHSRPHESQIAACASPQSDIIESREYLYNYYEKIKEMYHGKEIPPPKNWGGYRLSPDCFEFWQGQNNRLHDRIRFIRKGHTWKRERLAP